MNKRQIGRALSFLLLGLTPSYSYGSAIPSTSANAPLLYADNLRYLGAFRLPQGQFGSSSFSYGGSVITFHDRSLFVVGHAQQQQVAEVSVPTPVLDARLSALNTAKVLQVFTDVTEGNLNKIGAGGSPLVGTSARIGGLLVFDGRLIGTAYSYYDGSRQTMLSHFTTATEFGKKKAFKGMLAVGSAPATPGASFVSGFMCNVPADWQAELGGSVLTGNGGLSIISRTSFGPSAFSISPGDLGRLNPVPAQPLLYYPQSHPSLGKGAFTSPYFNLTTKIAGMLIVPETRSLLFFGYHGVGRYGYGDATPDPAYDGADPCPTSNTVCYYDPAGMGKGPHAFPYLYQVWAYDLQDLVAVKLGKKHPWEVLPYAVWNLPFKMAKTTLFGGAAAFDPATKRVFVSEPGGDPGRGKDALPLIHVFQVDLSRPSVGAVYRVKGTVLKLKGTVVLTNGSEEVSVSAVKRSYLPTFAFPTKVPAGAHYAITVKNQPNGQRCSVINGKGVVDAHADISNIVVVCDKP